MDRKYVNYIQDKIDSAFVSIGYKRPRRGTCYMEVEPGIYSWFGMPCDSRSTDAIYYSLNIGLHFSEIEKLAHKYSLLKYKVAEQPTLSATFQSVLGKSYRLFTFDPTTPEKDATEIERITTLMDEVAKPWFNSNARIEVAEKFLHSKTDMLGFWPERYACALLVQRKNNELEKFLQRHLTYVQNFDSEIIDSWKKFSNNVGNVA